jgi:20S proteasome subunit alpha 1
MSSEESAQSSHVSASKKAGGKLKRVKDTPAVEDGEHKEVDKKDKKTKDKKKKSKSSDGQGAENAAVTAETGKKKQKQKDEKSKKRRLDDENDGEEKAAAEPESESQQRRKKKKRVSFSADTVMRDGEESESESRPDVKDDSKTNGDAEEGQAPLATEEQADADDEGEKKKKKKEKKKKKKDQSVTTSSNATTTSHESPILSYLNLYHQHRSVWKFQKNRETHLFKHILSLEHIPAKYNAALFSYLKGLKSEGAKQRLQQVAEEVVKAEMEEDLAKEQEAETEDKAESDMTGYNKAVEAFRTRLSQGRDDFDEIETPDSLDGEQLAKLQRRQRAELVLFAVSGKLFYLEKTKAKRGPSTQAPPAKKKKKNRTAFVEISSSSESESSSDSEKKPKMAPKPKKDSSSESSSADSSSDSDDNGSHKKKTTRKKEAGSSESSSDSSSNSSSDSDSDSD